MEKPNATWTNNGTALNQTISVDPLYMLLPIAAICIPVFVLGTTSIIFIIKDLAKNATFARKLILLIIISDILGTIGIALKVYQSSFETSGDYLLCRFINIFVLYFYMLSGAVATTMSVDRCLALRTPYWYSRNNFQGNWTPLVLVAAALLVVCFIPDILQTRLVKKRLVNQREITICTTLPNEYVAGPETVFPMTFASVMILMTVVCLTCNVLVLITIKKMQKVIPWYNAIPNPTDFKMTKMLMAHSISYVVCFTPFIVIIFLVHVGVPVSSTFQMSSQILTGFNYIMDSGVYLFVHRKETMRKIFCRKKKETRIEVIEVD